MAIRDILSYPDPLLARKAEPMEPVGPDVLRHRVILTYEAEAEEISAEDIVRRLFEHVEVP